MGSGRRALWVKGERDEKRMTRGGSVRVREELVLRRSWRLRRTLWGIVGERKRC
jgi:hypothetical protein